METAFSETTCLEYGLPSLPFTEKLLQHLGFRLAPLYSDSSYFWAWLAFLATVLATVKFRPFCRKIPEKTTESPPEIFYDSDFDDESSIDDSDDSGASVSEISEEDERECSFSGHQETDFRHGQGCLGLDFTKGSVVKLWDNIREKALTLKGFPLSDHVLSDPRHVLSLWDSNKETIVSAFLSHGGGGGGRQNIPSDLVTSIGEGSEKRALKVWDLRAGRQVPAAVAEWDRLSGGVGQSSGRLVGVHDLRMMDGGMVALGASNGLEWWDAEDVAVVGGHGEEEEGSMVSWCYNAVRSISSTWAT
ncbi:uncharacterized protein LOC110007070 [Amborella trichopoda]|uniref:Uncharacterized protein n=1 Tax=Amborella trichopoda TaxID=13333 RepID=W1P2A1_AMBTC|nr:uncharacterized protein LOC110007070 [Amborella trichopoda]ERN03982.1 hypothetical protein AMTR_s00079p00124230 [Amborella trichopoda]|eukprot:XP_020521630.1 uncharacterized protein LOC110007070 [Amborella trichopoda]